jgi:hypothetical protein
MSDAARSRPSRFAALTVVCGAIIGVVSIALSQRLRPDLEAWLSQDLRTRVPIAMMTLAILTAGPAGALAAYLWREGTRSIGQRARVLRAVAAILALAAVGLVFMLWRLTALFDARLAP